MIFYLNGGGLGGLARKGDSLEYAISQNMKGWGGGGIS